jgi:hypothetical protein
MGEGSKRFFTEFTLRRKAKPFVEFILSEANELRVTAGEG